MSLIIPAAKAVISKQNRILFVRQNHKGKTYWDLPGGKLEFGESLVEALTREVKEETGLTVINPKLVGSWRFFGKKRDTFQIECITYRCETQSRQVNISNNPGDHIEEFRWISKDEFLSGRYPVPDKSLTEFIRSL